MGGSLFQVQCGLRRDQLGVGGRFDLLGKVARRKSGSAGQFQGRRLAGGLVDGQVDFKGKAKAFVRTYDFLASIIPYTNRDWERLSIVLNLLIPKLPAPKEEDLSKGILEAIDMDSYRVEKLAGPAGDLEVQCQVSVTCGF